MRTEYKIQNIPLVITPSLLKYIKDNGGDLEIDSYEGYKEFMLEECGEDALIQDLLNHMIEEKIVKWTYPDPVTHRLEYDNKKRLVHLYEEDIIKNKKEIERLEKIKPKKKKIIKKK